MSKDCGCVKKVVDKIYIEDSCCGKRLTKSNCGNSHCTSCGKLIDLIDSDLYADNIYNYTGNSSFNLDTVVLSEGEMMLSATNYTDYGEKIYNLLQEVNNETLLLVRLTPKKTQHYGLKSVATLRKVLIEGSLDQYNYIVVYVRKYKDLENSTEENIKIITKVYIYTNDGHAASLKDVDVTSYTIQEINELLELYVTKEELESLVEYIVTNSLTIKNYITGIIEDYLDDPGLGGEDCLFEVDKNNLNQEYPYSTKRKGDGSLAKGEKSFAIQGGKANSNNSIAMMSGTVGTGSSSSISIGAGSFSQEYDNVAGNEGKVTLLKSNLTCDHNASLYGGIASGKYSMAIKLDDSSDITSATNKGSVAIGMKAYCGGFHSAVLGHDVETGRFRELNSNGKYTYIGPSEENRQGRGSFVVGGYCTSIGAYNFVQGQNHFIKGSTTASFGYGNTDDKDSRSNLIFGTRCKTGKTAYSVVGGVYSQSGIGNSNIIKGTMSFGDTLPISNLYLLSTNRNSGNNYYFVIAYKSTDGGLDYPYIPVHPDSLLGLEISGSNMTLRNGTTRYTSEITFYDYKNGISENEKIYPGILNLRTSKSDPNGIADFIEVIIEDIKNANELDDLVDSEASGIPLNIIGEPNSTGKAYKCAIEFSNFGNIANGSGNIVLGTGNVVNSQLGIAIGTGNKVTRKMGVSLGRFNNPNSIDNSKSNLLFSIGNGTYDSEEQIIHRNNAFEIVEDSNGNVDIYFLIEKQKYSLKDIVTRIENLPSTNISEAENDNLINLTPPQIFANVLTAQESYGLDGRMYWNISGNTVYDPNNAVMQATTENDE